MKKVMLTIAASFTLLVVVGIGYWATQCPCERIPGVTLAGEETSEQIDDWSFVNDTGLCRIQVDDGLLPQSLLLNCMSASGELFVSCSRCADKRWSNTALGNPAGRLLVDGMIYPVNLQRLTEPARLDYAWLARITKLRSMGREAPDERPDHWWSFKLTSRDS